MQSLHLSDRRIAAPLPPSAIAAWQIGTLASPEIGMTVSRLATAVAVHMRLAPAPAGTGSRDRSRRTPRSGCPGASNKFRSADIAEREVDEERQGADVLVERLRFVDHVGRSRSPASPAGWRAVHRSPDKAAPHPVLAGRCRRSAQGRSGRNRGQGCLPTDQWPWYWDCRSRDVERQGKRCIGLGCDIPEVGLVDRCHPPPRTGLGHSATLANGRISPGWRLPSRTVRPRPRPGLEAGRSHHARSPAHAVRGTAAGCWRCGCPGRRSACPGR